MKKSQDGKFIIRVMKKHEDKKDQHVQDLENQVKRTLADYQNLEKRVAQEKGEWAKIANKDLLLKLLPVLDTLVLAKNHIQDEGLNLSIQQFLGVLESVGVRRIDTQNQTFDPNLMEAVERTGEGDKVLEEARAGFMIFDKVLRPAQVKVG